MTTTLPAFVSVVVATFERGYCVADAVESVLAQTHAEVECVVVDDGSTDGTVAHLAHHFGRDPRVRVLHGRHQGVSAARNRGVRAAHGELVTFLDSDDLLGPTALERQLRCLADGADAVVGRFERVLAGIGEWPPVLRDRPEWRGGYSCTSVLTPRRHVLAVGGFDEQLTTGEDIDLLARLVGCGLRVARLEQTIVSARCFGDNLITLDEPDRSAWLRAVRAHRRRQHAAAG